MVNLVFFHPNVFNVLKYVVFSLTIGCTADIVLNTFMCHHASRTLQREGRYCPAHTNARLPISRWNASHLSLFVIIFIAVALEIALDFSTGATSIWITSMQTFRISTQVSNVSQLAYATPDYLVQLRYALQRTEGTCFNIYDQWYSPVSFNLTNSTDFLNLADATLCPQNRSRRVNATSLIKASSFSAAHLLQTNIWNRSQLAIGRDTHSAEDQVPYDQVGDVKIGAFEKYSFVSANFSDFSPIPGSETPLTGNTSHHSPWAFETTLHRKSGGPALECLLSVLWKLDKQTGELKKETLDTNACLVPITGHRSVVALYDVVTGGGGQKRLIMSVALEGVTTFHDLRVLKAVPFLMGSNDRMHTNRELATLAVLCSQMITALGTDGLQDVRMEVDGEHVTVPTWSVWGIVLLFVGILGLISLKVLANRLRRSIRVRGNLVSAKGVAEHWLAQEELFEGVYGRKGQVVLVREHVRHDEWTRVGVQREDHVVEKQESEA